MRPTSAKGVFTAMDEQLDEYESGQIHFRDKWQFELKSDLYPFVEARNALVQEFYIFIPNSLQINDQTYTSAQFYQDQTNLIRFKTPEFTFPELTDPHNTESPLTRLNLLKQAPPTEENQQKIQTESQLLGNIVHSALRHEMSGFLVDLDYLEDPAVAKKFIDHFLIFCHEVEHFRQAYLKTQEAILTSWPNLNLKKHLDCVDEFLSANIHGYFSNFLVRLREKKQADLSLIDQRLCEMILSEAAYRENKFGQNGSPADHLHRDEYLLYRKGLLNKFIIDPLLLKTSRSSVDQRYRAFITGIPAAIAMLLYMLLFVWQGTFFVINTEPFILLTVVIYVLKDRLKEELRYLSHRQAARWFSDYTTEICAPPDDTVMGKLRESFSFIDGEKIPREVLEIRDRHFHSVLEEVKRPERVLYYKKTVDLYSKPTLLESRFYGLNIIFRLDIHHFLNKAEDPYQSYLTLDPQTLKLRRVQLPKVYHINIIIRSYTVLPNGQNKDEMKKYRLIVDKIGIKRIERV
jgi:hypothetical protein